MESRLDTALLEMRQGSWDNALTIYEEVVSQLPQAPNVHNNMGYALMQLGRFEEALSHFEAAGQQQPEGVVDGTVLHNWANTLEKLKRYPEAEAKYRQAAQAAPDGVDVFINWGNVLVQLERLPEAAERFRTAVEHNPEMGLGWFNLGYALERQGKPRKALVAYRTFVELESEKPSSRLEHAREFVAQAAAAARTGAANP